MTEQTTAKPPETAELGRFVLLIFGALIGFYLGGEAVYAFHKWQSPVFGGETLMAASYSALFVGGPVGAIVGGVLAWFGGRRVQHLLTGWVVLGLALALAALLWWGAGEAGFR